MCSSRADHSVKSSAPPSCERDRRESGANATGPSSCGCAVDPQRALAVVRRVVHAGDEVPRDRAAVRRRSVARRPHPGGVARVVAGAVVDERDAVDLAAPAVEHDARRAPARAPACGSRCSCRPCPAGEAISTPSRLLEREVDLHAVGVDPHPRARHVHPAAADRRLARAGVPSGSATAHQRCGTGPMRASAAHSIRSAL